MTPTCDTCGGCATASDQRCLTRSWSRPAHMPIGGRMASPSSRRRSWVRSAIPLRVGRANAPFSNTSVVFAMNERGGSPSLHPGHPSTRDLSRNSTIPVEISRPCPALDCPWSERGPLAATGGADVDRALVGHIAARGRVRQQRVRRVRPRSPRRPRHRPRPEPTSSSVANSSRPTVRPARPGPSAAPCNRTRARRSSPSGSTDRAAATSFGSTTERGSR